MSASAGVAAGAPTGVCSPGCTGAAERSTRGSTLRRGTTGHPGRRAGTRNELRRQGSPCPTKPAWLFIKGDWSTAQQKMEGAADFCPEDIPTRLLMREMKELSIDPAVPTAPVDWKGHHDSDV